MNATVKLLLVDDHPMLRHGLRDALAQQPDLSLTGEAATGALAVKLAEELSPDLVVMDIHLPDMNGIEAARKILSVRPSVKIIIFSSDDSRALVDDALEAGVCGYVFKSGAVEELLHAITLVMKGKLYLSPEVSADILEDYRRSLVNPVAAEPFLSEREMHLLRLIAEGRRNKEIAGLLFISTKSVEAYRSRLMKKLDCTSAAELVRYAVREGIAVA